MSREAVVTGLGLWTPYGRGPDAFWKGLMSGQPASSKVDRFDSDRKGYRTNMAASISGMGSEVSGETERTAAEFVNAVLSDAIADSGVSSRDLSPYEVGVVVGVTQGTPPPVRPLTQTPEMAIWGLGSGAVLRQIVGCTRAQGYVASISTACASGTQSIGIGYGLIRNGQARRVFTGGLGYFSEISFSGFNTLRVLSKDGCRPFDAKRDGVMLGDAFVLIVLEEEDLARDRGARIYGRVLGYACGNEAFHATAPDPSGTAACDTMRRSLGCGSEHLERLDYVNAHGTGTIANDSAELAAIARLAANRSSRHPIAVSSTKGHHGHALGAAGSVEFSATLLAIVHQAIPATCGLETVTASYDSIDLVRGGPLQRPVRVALSNSFAFGGVLASIAIGAA